MTLNEFAQTSTSDFWHMPLADLKREVSKASQSANRRYQNIKYNLDADKTAVEDVDHSGGRFTSDIHKLSGIKYNREITDKTQRKVLVQEAKRIKNFLNSPSGTVKGAKEQQHKKETATKGTTKHDYQKNQEKLYKKSGFSDKDAKKLAKNDANIFGQEVEEKYHAYRTYRRTRVTSSDYDDTNPEDNGGGNVDDYVEHVNDYDNKSNTEYDDDDFLSVNDEWSDDLGNLGWLMH